ncbi:hypothetical protein [Peptoniphilus indolicus]|uniref:Uncharacterized protein n=2 Tax=Peptoniphilus indolicus TaxID=33030 RepID=G4D6M0_9FIRM|nr:hypothetical protein [Peptoniphilus indolicus]EGY76447.1 hypothetical protein HMPREF9129_2050 [Peptoniphilus indolicus ATCC 29427]SUB76036.1 Uncharacterised protein [Peptoniphilus indolicus]
MAKKYDGSVELLANKSRRPDSHPNEHTKEELELLRKNTNAINTKEWVKYIENAFMQDINEATTQCVNK